MFCNLRGGSGGLGWGAARRCFSSGVEISIPVPWGIIAGKEWGPPDGKPWLAVHGWLDNAGSFDTLMPEFAKDKRVVAIDYPGHGSSSHLPKGANYHELESIGFFERVVKHLRWDTFSFLGHSMGGDFGSVYAAVFPEKLKSLIMLDILGPAVNGDNRDPERVVEVTRKAIILSLALEKKRSLTKPEKAYKRYEEALDRLLAAAKSGNGEITPEAAEIILKRGLKKSTDGYCFARDIRLLALSKDSQIYGMPRNFLQDLAKSIQIPHLIVKGSEGPIYDSQQNVDDILGIYKQNPTFEFHTVEGGHHVHLTHPERVLPVLNDFIKSYNL